jgi:hypothetical protein
VAAELRTARGFYRVGLVSPLEVLPDESIVTLALERADGIERITLRCRIARGLITGDADYLLARLGPWLEREFEGTREAALKTIRADRKLLELRFDRESPGPFALPS